MVNTRFVLLFCPTHSGSEFSATRARSHIWGQLSVAEVKTSYLFETHWFSCRADSSGEHLGISSGVLGDPKSASKFPLGFPLQKDGQNPVFFSRNASRFVSRGPWDPDPVAGSEEYWLLRQLEDSRARSWSCGEFKKTGKFPNGLPDR